MTETPSAIPVVLPPMGTFTPEQTANKSKTHWVWPPYKDINNMGPIDINSQLGYRDQRWSVLKRCVPYPLSNLIESRPDREAAESSHTSSLSVNSEVLPRVERTKYAEDQAKELFDSYQDAGLRILTPLLGMDDAELVQRIVEVVQPFAFAIHEMDQEFSIGAESRIERSNLSLPEQTIAYELAKVFRAGAAIAMTKALSEYEALISSMSDKMAGGPGISNPNSYHEWVCQMLNKPVPARIDRTGGQGNNSAAIDILAKCALKEESAAEAMAEQLAAEREARERDRQEFERRLAVLEKKKSAA